MTSAKIRFDDSLPCLARAIAENLGREALEGGTALRDLTGRLCFFASLPLSPERLEDLGGRLRAALGDYARPDRVLADPSDLSARSVLEDVSAVRVVVGDLVVRLVDRRLVGADWLQAPVDAPPAPRRFVFSSVKGGVGRTTALAVTAAYLAQKGSSVLVVDLDLEAPGLGALLLSRATTPEFGSLDYLVENSLGELDDTFVADIVGPSSLATHRGRIDVVPAFGRRSINHPGDVLAKISRAYLETVRDDGTTATMSDQIRTLVERAASRERYDAVLVDARAGLHETTAASILGLGADVFLFGLDEPQTFHGYAALLAHLSRLTNPGEPTPEWMERLTPVQAKAPADQELRNGFSQRWLDMVARISPSTKSTPAPSVDVPIPEGFKDVPWDETLPDDEVLPVVQPAAGTLAVLRDDRYAGFDPLRNPEQIESDLCLSTFGDVIKRVQSAIAAGEEGSP